MFVYDIEEGLSLRTLQHEDAPELFNLIDQSREYLKEWLPWVGQTVTVNDSVEFITNSEELWNHKIGMNLGIFYQGKLVGMSSFNQLDWHNKIGYIGYWLAEAYQGKGIITRVVRALTDYGFYQLQLNRIDIRAAYENKKSRRIPERLGYKMEGQIRQAEWLYNHYVDHVIYGMLANEWENMKRGR